MTTEEKIWACLDGQADEATRQWVEERRASDPVFRAEYAEREVLHRRLKNIPLAAPSMRFAQNLMDRLPTMNVPLIPQRQLRLFWRGALGFLVLYFLTIALFGSRPVGGEGGGFLTNFLDTLLKSVPNSTLEVAAALFLGLFLLFLADRYLAKSSRSSRLRG